MILRYLQHTPLRWQSKGSKPNSAHPSASASPSHTCTHTPSLPDSVSSSKKFVVIFVDCDWDHKFCNPCVEWLPSSFVPSFIHYFSSVWVVRAAKNTQPSQAADGLKHAKAPHTRLLQRDSLMGYGQQSALRIGIENDIAVGVGIPNATH